MITSSNGNIFRVTGHLCREFTGPGEFPTQRPVRQSFDVFFDLRLNKRLSKQCWGWWFEMLSSPLWRHCNEITTPYSIAHKTITTKAWDVDDSVIELTTDTSNLSWSMLMTCGIHELEPFQYMKCIIELECGTWYHHPRRLQCVLSTNLRIFKVATWHYQCRHNVKIICIWDNLKYCLLVPRSPSKPVMLTEIYQFHNLTYFVTWWRHQWHHEYIFI